jgi:two-component system, OmpR family, response regulator RpaA
VTRANYGRDFTTGEVAKLVGVAPRTVSKWFDSGRLRGHRIPASNDRRIPRRHLLDFALANGLEDLVAALNPPPPVVFLAGLPPHLAHQLRPLLGDTPAAEGGVFEAGVFATDHPPGSSAVLDGSLGRSAALTAAAGLAAAGVRVVGLPAEDDIEAGEWIEVGCAAALRHPVDPAELARLLRGES